jgi:hypothetical protein
MKNKQTSCLQLRNSILYYNLEVLKIVIYFKAANKDDDDDDDDDLFNTKPSIAQSL